MDYRVPTAKVIVLVVMMLLCPKESTSQALRPYEPPGIRLQPQDSYQSPAQMARPRVNEEVYGQFRTEVRQMTSANRKRLTDAVQQRLDRARQAGRSEEVIHNERLLGILGSIR